VTGEQRKARNNILNSMSSSPCSRVIKSIRVRCTKYEEHMGKIKKNHTKFCSKNMKRHDHFGNVGVYERVLLKQILKK
jgi:hypothetical protein